MAATITFGATTVPIAGLVRAAYNNPTFAGVNQSVPQGGIQANGDIVFTYSNGSTITLSAPADCADCLATLPLIQSYVQTVQFPSQLA
jgi:hypothetical protein